MENVAVLVEEGSASVKTFTISFNRALTLNQRIITTTTTVRIRRRKCRKILVDLDDDRKGRVAGVVSYTSYTTVVTPENQRHLFSRSEIDFSRTNECWIFNERTISIPHPVIEYTRMY
jgi:hypothetical protein